MLNRSFAYGVAPGAGVPAEWGGVTPYLDYNLDYCSITSGRVSALPDRSGNARDATIGGTLNAVPGTGPLYIAQDAAFGNAPSMHFSGDIARFVRTPTITPGTNGKLEIFLVAISGASVDFPTNCYAISSANDNVSLYVPNGTGDGPWTGWGDPGFASLDSDDIASTAAHIVHLSISGESSAGAANSTTKLFVDRYTNADDTNAGRARVNAAQLILGTNWGTPSTAYALGGRIARLLVYAPATSLTSGQRQSIIQGLGQKYAIATAA